MNIILSKKSRYKKYGNVALIKNLDEKEFVVAFNFNSNEHSYSYCNTPSENTFKFKDEKTEIKALKDAINKYESIRT